MQPSAAEAVMNLLSHVPRHVRQRLHHAVSNYGMNRGPVTHAFLGSKALRVGFSQPYDDAVWNSEMVSAGSTVEMIVERVLFNFERAPQGLRKSAGADVAGLMQKLCRSFKVYCELLKQRVGEAPGVSVKSWFCYCFVLKHVLCAMHSQCCEILQQWAGRLQ